MTLRSLKIRGPYRGPTGYDHHVREFTRAIAAAGVDVQLVDIPAWSGRTLPRELRDPWFDSLRVPVPAQISLQFCMPHQVQRDAGLPVANFTMFEASQLPRLWIDALPRSVITIVPEEFSRSIWLAAGVSEEQIAVCPLGVDAQLFAQDAEALPLIAPDGENLATRQTRFLSLAEVVPRKNHLGMLRAWLLETDRTDDAVLVLKLGLGPNETAAVLDPFFAQLEVETGKRFCDAAPVHLVTKLFSDQEMPRLFAAATHYWSMSFGEGWDLTMMEAAASGLHLIAPNHTAYRTYLSTQTATLLPVREIPVQVEGDTRVFFRNGATWWEPDRDAARRALRAAIEGKESTVASPRDWILGNWTWRHAADRLVGILADLEERNPSVYGSYGATARTADSSE